MVTKKKDQRKSTDTVTKKKRSVSEDSSAPPTKKRALSPSTVRPGREEEIRTQLSLKSPLIGPCCPVSGCNSQGHMNGRDARHITIAGCPFYHNLTGAECRGMRERDIGQPTALETAAALFQSTAASALIDATHPVAGPVESKEPPLTGLTSSYDMYLFRRAQQRLVDDRTHEVAHHLTLSTDKDYRIRHVVLGRYQLVTWYISPYPPDVARMPIVYICEFCLKYVKYKVTYMRHVAKCPLRHPPGDEIYRKKEFSFFEVDGEKHTKYCQNLCLMAKLFLQHKTLYEDVAPFLFYVLAKTDSDGAHTVGYFSKEKKSLQNYNLSCILTFPQYMRQGYGKVLIEFSYLLSRVEGKIGSPERPLSDLGLISYRSYWKEILVKYLSEYQRQEISIRDISQETRIHTNDIVSTLLSMGLLKYWKGQYLLVRKKDVVEKYMKKFKQRSNADTKIIEDEYLHWTPKNYH